MISKADAYKLWQYTERSTWPSLLEAIDESEILDEGTKKELEHKTKRFSSRNAPFPKTRDELYELLEHY